MTLKFLTTSLLEKDLSRFVLLIKRKYFFVSKKIFQKCGSADKALLKNWLYNSYRFLSPSLISLITSQMEHYSQFQNLYLFHI